MEALPELEYRRCPARRRAAWNATMHAEALPAYDGVRAELAKRWSSGARRGDPEATADAILKVVDADEPPLRIFFGIGPLELIRGEYASRIATWEQWNAVSEEAHGAS